MPVIPRTESLRITRAKEKIIDAEKFCQIFPSAVCQPDFFFEQCSVLPTILRAMEECINKVRLINQVAARQSGARRVKNATITPNSIIASIFSAKRVAVKCGVCLSAESGTTT